MVICIARFYLRRFCSSRLPSQSARNVAEVTVLLVDMAECQRMAVSQDIWAQVAYPVECARARVLPRECVPGSPSASAASIIIFGAGIFVAIASIVSATVILLAIAFGVTALASASGVVALAIPGGMLARSIPIGGGIPARPTIR